MEFWQQWQSVVLPADHTAVTQHSTKSIRHRVCLDANVNPLHFRRFGFRCRIGLNSVVRRTSMEGHRDKERTLDVRISQITTIKQMDRRARKTITTTRARTRDHESSSSSSSTTNTLHHRTQPSQRQLREMSRVWRRYRRRYSGRSEYDLRRVGLSP